MPKLKNPNIANATFYVIFEQCATCHLTKHENWTEKLRVAGASKYKMQLSFQVTARPFATFAYFKKKLLCKKEL